MNHSENITGTIIRKRIESDLRKMGSDRSDEGQKDIDKMFDDNSNSEERYMYFRLGKTYFKGYAMMGLMFFFVVLILNLYMFDNNWAINYLGLLPGAISVGVFLVFQMKEKQNEETAASYTTVNLMISLLIGLILAFGIAYLIPFLF